MQKQQIEIHCIQLLLYERMRARSRKHVITMDSQRLVGNSKRSLGEQVQELRLLVPDKCQELSNQSAGSL